MKMTKKEATEFVDLLTDLIKAKIDEFDISCNDSVKGFRVFSVQDEIIKLLSNKGN